MTLLGLFLTVKLEANKMSFSRQMDKQNVVHACIQFSD